MTLLLLASSQMGTTESTEDLFKDFADWCLRNNLQINAGKTKELVVDFRRHVDTLCLHRLSRVADVKDKTLFRLHHSDFLFLPQTNNKPCWSEQDGGPEAVDGGGSAAGLRGALRVNLLSSKDGGRLKMLQSELQKQEAITSVCGVSLRFDVIQGRVDDERSVRWTKTTAVTILTTDTWTKKTDDITSVEAAEDPGVHVDPAQPAEEEELLSV
ncbi:hypothetical protein L3Q82_002589 [Scortum barcoo]|uniref:Uncharacterized protein n=1 Tax=Scortum barcoo TaxID=214431 RepID=A0ACB8VUE5_9TELE|nr:hypothetical protein L3Q82_002589 [Scortum barcoo]